MREVNPELMSEADTGRLLRLGIPGFAEGVAKLFGTSHPNVRRAVDEFLRKGPSSFDHHLLRIVAAAGAAFEDKNHVAHMIRRLRPTDLELVAKPIDLETARRQFKTSLPQQYRQETRRALVLDLICMTTLDVLCECPTARVPERGQEIVREHLRRMLRNGKFRSSDVLDSSFADEELISLALDRIEARIERVEKNRADESQALDGNELYGVFTFLASRGGKLSISDRLYERTWRLYERCESNLAILLYTSSNPRLLAVVGREMLVALEHHERADPTRPQIYRRTRGEMLAFRELPEDAARDAVSAGVSLEMARSVGAADVRLAFLRARRYAHRGGLLASVSTDDLDGAVVSASDSELTANLVSSVESEWAIEALVRRVPSMPEEVLLAFVRCPNLQPVHFLQIIDLCRSHLVWNGQEMPPMTSALLLHENADDEVLASVIARSHQGASLDEQSIGLMSTHAACHRAAGSRVETIVRSHCSRLHRTEASAVLETIATNSGSHHMRRALAGIAMSNDDRRLAAALMCNGLLDARTWKILDRRFPAAFRYQVQVVASCPPARHGYDERDVADVVLSGDSPSGRAEGVVRMAGLRPSIARLAERILDAGLVPDESLVNLAGDIDMRVALLAATDQRTCSLDTEGVFVLPVETRLRDTVHAIEAGLGAMPPDKHLSSWTELPNLEDEPFDFTPFHQAIDGQVVDGLTVTVPRTPRALVKISSEMRNCLSDYVDAVADGSQIIVVARAHDDVYAAAIWVHDDSREVSDVVWPAPGRESKVFELEEIGSKYNGSDVPASFATAVQEMVAELNSGTLRPVSDQLDVAVSDPDPGRPSTTRRLARPPRRQQAVTLRTDSDETSRDAGQSDLEPESSSPPTLLHHAPELDLL